MSGLGNLRARCPFSGPDTRPSSLLPPQLGSFGWRAAAHPRPWGWGGDCGRVTRRIKPPRTAISLVVAAKESGNYQGTLLVLVGPAVAGRKACVKLSCLHLSCGDPTGCSRLTAHRPIFRPRWPEFPSTVLTAFPVPRERTTRQHGTFRKAFPGFSVGRGRALCDAPSLAGGATLREDISCFNDTRDLTERDLISQNTY